MKKASLVAVLCLVAMTGSVMAQSVCETEKCSNPCFDFASDIKTTVDASIYTKYMFYGVDVYDDQGAFQPSVTFDFGDTGFSAMLWYSTALDSGQGVNGASNAGLQEFNYAFNYANSFNACETTQVDYNLGYKFHDFFNYNKIDARKSKNINFYEVTANFAMPNLNCYGVVPHYQATYISPYNGGGDNDGAAGWIHVFGLAYDFNVFCPIQNKEQPVQLSWDIVYNDGAGVFDGYNADHDWQHMTFGLKAPMQLCSGTFTPAIYYQKNLDSALSDLNDDTEELYAGFSYKFSF